MQILVSHAGQQLGPFSLDQLRVEIAAGRITMQDLAWWEGQSAWVPVAQVPGVTQQPIPQVVGYTPVAPGGDDGSGLATGSLVLGIVGLVGGACFTGLPAIICGHMALSRQKRTGQTKAKGLAIAGLIMGYLTTILTLVVIPLLFAAIAIPSFNSARDGAKLAQSMSHVRTVMMSCEMYALNHDDEFPPSLSALVPGELTDSSMLQDPLAPEFGRDGYFYMKPGKDADGQTVVIASRGKTKDGKRAVGHKDGSVESRVWNPPPDL